jgi:nucleoside-diphosphate-sugar epimerase
MLQGGLHNSVRRFVLAGSCFEYGLSGQNYERIPTDAPLMPNKPYDASKAAATILAQAFARQNNLEMAVLRPFQVFGEGEPMNRLWPALKTAAQSGEDFDMTPGEQLRDFVPVDQVAEAFVRYALNENIEKGIPETKNIGTGNPTSVAEFASYWWWKWQATGNLNLNKFPYRDNEVMRYVPEV